jgi:hypothetical protein
MIRSSHHRDPTAAPSRARQRTNQQQYPVPPTICPNLARLIALDPDMIHILWN